MVGNTEPDKPDKPEHPNPSRNISHFSKPDYARARRFLGPTQHYSIHLTLHPFLNSKEDFHYQNIVYALKEAGLQSLQEVQGVQHDTQGVVRPHRHRHFESLDSVTVTGEAAADRCLLHCLRPKSILCCSQLKLRLVVLSVVTTAPC